MNILVIQIKMVGDVLTSTIMAESIKKKYPDSKIFFLIEANSSDILHNNPYVDEIILFTKKNILNPILFLKLLNEIKSKNIAVIIDAYCKLSSMLITYFISVDKKIGYYKFYSSFIYNFPIRRITKPENNSSLAIENRLLLLTPLKINYSRILPKLYISNNEKINIQSFLKKKNIKNSFILINILGSNPKKTYPINYMVKLIEYISENLSDKEIFFNYLPNQIHLAKKIYSMCSLQTKNKINFDIYANSLRDFILLTSQSVALIGNEGGGTNISKALCIPTFTIFSPYLKTENWSYDTDLGLNKNIHLSNYLKFDIGSAKNNPEKYYQLFKPEYFYPELDKFLKKIN